LSRKQVQLPVFVRKSLNSYVRLPSLCLPKILLFMCVNIAGAKASPDTRNCRVKMQEGRCLKSEEEKREKG
jgi:hypothetical protein